MIYTVGHSNHPIERFLELLQRQGIEVLADTELFRQGIERLLAAGKMRATAIMCAEKDPLDCHRTILVARALEARGQTIAHILASGEIE